MAQLPPLLRHRELEAYGLSGSRLRGMLRRGEVQRVVRGVYRLRGAEPTEHETIATVCKKVPGAIVCLLSALEVHGIGTQAPRHVWIALDRKARRPALHRLPVRVVRFSGPMLRYGVVTKTFQGVPVRITSPARTVVDCFRYRHKIGVDVALEALRDVLRSRLATIDEIVRAADACRARTVVQPYLEALSS